MALSFNEARAFCAGNRETQPAHRSTYPASMRPALSAREIRRNCDTMTRMFPRFNEARAFCAGNQRCKGVRLCWIQGFNEARAFCAGNHLTLKRVVTNRALLQ